MQTHYSVINMLNVDFLSSPQFLSQKNSVKICLQGVISVYVLSCVVCPLRWQSEQRERWILLVEELMAKNEKKNSEPPFFKDLNFFFGF